ncbi:MAG: lipoprotein signal peptidase [Betaproteobacteria bacterium]|nr:Lipoprotein signal peptidase [Rhodocyclaceae bacterium]
MHDQVLPAVMPRAALKRWLAVVAAVVLLDQLSKLWVLHTLPYAAQIEVTGFFDIVHVHNPGAAFSFLAGADGWQRWLFVVLALLISAYLGRLLARHAAQTAFAAPLALILAGAIGNLIDRLWLGRVIDFLYFHAGPYGFPAFNVADAGISVGVVVILWQQLRAGPDKAGEGKGEGGQGA